ncbi:hypothetical protein DFP72DRAFT_929643 [Ephemerocybe angulata]|uniref:NYN domain-containing protein n=1 Tax=Ephemerocybe angulata TaxID=980116 RepID=A0A8H6HEG3_9AGAR|nr:hypothetical protein DFP72DRAFT_929643 [Tulosesus angulatus]
MRSQGSTVFMKASNDKAGPSTSPYSREMRTSGGRPIASGSGTKTEADSVAEAMEFIEKGVDVQSEPESESEPETDVDWATRYPPPQHWAFGDAQSSQVPPPVAVFWDYESCPIPHARFKVDQGQDFLSRIKAFVGRLGSAESAFCAYIATEGDIPPEAHQAVLQRNGITLCCMPRNDGVRDIVDHHIMVDVAYSIKMNPNLKTVVLISKDVDYSVLMARVLAQGLNLVHIFGIPRKNPNSGKAVAYPAFYNGLAPSSRTP